MPAAKAVLGVATSGFCLLGLCYKGGRGVSVVSPSLREVPATGGRQVVQGCCPSLLMHFSLGGDLPLPCFRMDDVNRPCPGLSPLKQLQGLPAPVDSQP